MLAIGVRVLLFLAIVYAGLLLIIYVRQDRFLYPAPQERYLPAPGYEVVSLATEDGLALKAHWRAPRGDCPTLVHFHGNSGSLQGAAAENESLVEAGFGALLVEYRGYGGNPGRPSEKGFYADGRAAMAFLREQSVPGALTIVKGHSIGTGTATLMAQEFAPAAVILLAPFTSIKDRVAQAFPILPVRAILRSDFDNAGRVAKLTMPVLVQHGSDDTIIPESHGKALGRAGDHVTYQSFEGSGHELTFEAGVQRAQLDWLDGLGLTEGDPAPDSGRDTAQGDVSPTDRGE